MEVVPEVRFQGDLPAQSTLLVEVKSRVPQVSSSSKPGCGRQRKSSYLNECRGANMIERVGELSRFHGVSIPTFHKAKRGAPGVRLIRKCAQNDDNCKKWLDECGDTVLDPLGDGMFPT